MQVWRILKLSVTPKCHRSEYNACDKLEFPWGLSDFCEDWVEQLHQLGLKNKGKPKTIRDRDQKYKLYTHWEQLNISRNLQKIKKEVLGKWKRDLENSTRVAEISAALLDATTVHREAALEWTDVNKLLRADKIIRFDALDILENDEIP